MIQEHDSLTICRLPSLRLTTTHPLPPLATRILHKLSTTTSPFHLLPLLSKLLASDLHRRHPILSSSFILTSLLSLRRLSPALLLLSHLPLHPPLLLHPFNTLLRSLSPSLPPSLSLFLFLQLLHNSIPPNRHTFIPLLSSSLPVALRLHSRLLKSGFLPSDPLLSSSLLRIYSSHSMSYCHQLFAEMTLPNAVTWTSLLSAYNSSGRYDDALAVFGRMCYSNVKPNRVTMIAALTACSARGDLDTGVWIHEAVKREKLRVDVVLGTAIVGMYGKCGRVKEGIRVFEGLEERNVRTWNAVIGGLAREKRGEEAMEWLLRMEEEGVRPDEVTVIEVLRGCCHAGLVEKGRKVFGLMLQGRYGFRPGVKHYGCMVDLLSRAGFLDEAMEMIERMPFEAGVVVWGAMLGGCRAHGNLRLGEVAAKRLVELEPENAGHYVVLSNLYVEMGRWKEAEELRRRMEERGSRGSRKDAGWGFADVDEPETGHDYCLQQDFVQI